MRALFTFGVLALVALIPLTSSAILAECNPETGQCEPVTQTPTPEPLDRDNVVASFSVGKTITYAVLALVAITLLIGSVFIVSQQPAVVIERFGKFRRVAPAGIHLKIPLVDREAGELDLRVQQPEASFTTPLLIH